MQDLKAAYQFFIPEELSYSTFLYQMQLASVTLIGPTPQPNNLPTLGVRKETRVTIASNDDANGVWRIYSNSPEAVNGQLVLVTETEGVSVSVELVVERQGQ